MGALMNQKSKLNIQNGYSGYSTVPVVLAVLAPEAGVLKDEVRR